MTTISQPMTAEEFTAYAATHGRCELVRGEVRTLSPSGARHGEITARLHYFVSKFVYENNLGRMYAAETGFRLDDRVRNNVRAADVAYIAEARASAADTVSFAPVAPDLVAEVLSPHDRASEVEEKIDWWLDHGVKLVWIVDPENRTVTTHLPSRQSQRLHENESLGGGEVLPGFMLRLSELFR